MDTTFLCSRSYEGYLVATMMDIPDEKSFHGHDTLPFLHFAVCLLRNAQHPVLAFG